mgnify:CR=1 FL=1
MLTAIKQTKQILAQGGVLAAAVAGFLAFGAAPQTAFAQSLLNVSYDPTRELYDDINKAFVDYWVGQGNAAPEIQASHGGSGAQARAVIDGLAAQVVTLALASDIDQIAARTDLIPALRAVLEEGMRAIQP